ncbi:MAG: hypothetical protein JWO83_1605 [Caulobacteraceae bacterium]|nr:hypothetical protein [Caulobacteraceae bacterium]
MDRATAAAVYTTPALEALEAFPVALGEISLLTVAENVSFRVTDRDSGDQFVLRLHRPGYHTFEELVSERAWTRALNEVGIPAPLGIRAMDGRDYVEAAVPKAGERRHAGLLRWTDGKLLADVLARKPEPGRTAAYYRQLGALEGAMHNQSSAWNPPAGFVRHHLDIDGLLGETPFWGRFWEHPKLCLDERKLLLSARDRMRDRLQRFGKKPSNYSVVHADLHPNNVLVAADGLAVIDFDDAGFGWHAYDIAVALFAVRDKADFETFKAAFLDGYTSRRALEPEADSLIPMFILIRGMASIGWLAQRPELNSPDYRQAFEEIRGWVIQGCRALELNPA